MLYLIGLGLDKDGISLHGKKILKSAAIKKIYLEEYTVDFPYTKKELEKELKIKIIPADRTFVESEKIIDEAKKEDIALLVYGSPLVATTHISLINTAKKQKLKCKILHSGSVFDAVAESGLSLYKFGKTTSLPKWQKNFEPKSFIDVIKENQSIGAHTLLLIDIGLNFEDAREQLNKTSFKFDKIIVACRLGIKSKFFYETLDKIDEKKVEAPYCIIVPGKISHDEEVNLNSIN
ncbi:diphthine synthase [Candidatus Pacearchaeota archaeon CG10_big_fil_rev_8_21_14_0_10_31_9]|nr:MAG: diphthine synthase [Candidatus Pacearchaeota archaeon CG10_big_fil_rev_8_21_14_0_10_31_9]PIZ82700.1 MAG: diphthine synthase [Candidatus Pacearchaeota archaeon CG_4_10_14_0_2_um_filter_05_32_18]